MTISLERSLLANRSMVEPYSLVDAYDEPHTVVSLRLLVTRDQLAAAVQLGAGDFYGGERHPDELTVDETRTLARMNLASMSSLELQQAAEAVAAMAESSRAMPEDRAIAQAVYRAVDRAFPKTA